MTFRPHAIEIDGGILKSTTVYDAHGSHQDYHGIGDYHFFVDLIEEGGGRLGLWSGFNYSDAIREAETARIELEISE